MGRRYNYEFPDRLRHADYPDSIKHFGVKGMKWYQHLFGREQTGGYAKGKETKGLDDKKESSKKGLSLVETRTTGVESIVEYNRKRKAIVDEFGEKEAAARGYVHKAYTVKEIEDQAARNRKGIDNDTNMTDSEKREAHTILDNLIKEAKDLESKNTSNDDKHKRR